MIALNLSSDIQHIPFGPIFPVQHTFLILVLPGRSKNAVRGRIFFLPFLFHLSWKALTMNNLRPIEIWRKGNYESSDITGNFWVRSSCFLQPILLNSYNSRIGPHFKNITPSSFSIFFQPFMSFFRFHFLHSLSIIKALRFSARCWKRRDSYICTLRERREKSKEVKS